MKNSSYTTFLKKADIILVPVGNTAKIKKNISKIAALFGLDNQLLEMDFAGNAGETLKLFPPKGIQRLYLVGCGKEANFKSVADAFKRFSFKENTKLQGEIGIDFSYVDCDEALLEATINGLLLGTYQVGLYKTDTKETTSFKSLVESLSVWSSLDKETIQLASEKAIATAQTQLQIMDLVNAPGNEATPQALADWAVQSGKKHNYKVTVLHKKEIKKNGLHTLLAVNRGSEYPPEFIIMEYKPKGKKKLPTIGLVGKGVTFDTGGLSIKGNQNMHYMKCDMGGAAAVMGAVELAAKLDLPVHLIGVVPATDNCVDATAVKPGDVISSYLGKTIEIIDTDAEGRLILADGIAYLNKNYQPDVLIDVATLTGSCVRTLGYSAGGLFTSSDELAIALVAAGQRTGERLWQLPIWDEYLSEIQSDVADIKNFSGRPLAGAIVAAKFIEFFTEKHPHWAHLDIAGVAFGDSGLSREKSATAYGINLLVNYLQHL